MQSPAAKLVLSHVLCPRSINQIIREMIRNRHYHQGNPTTVVRVANGPCPSIGSVIDHLRKFSLMLLPPKKMLMRRTNVPIKNSTLVSLHHEPPPLPLSSSPHVVAQRPSHPCQYSGYYQPLPVVGHMSDLLFARQQLISPSSERLTSHELLS